MQFIYTLITYKKLQQNLWRTQTINNTLCLPYKVDQVAGIYLIRLDFIGNRLSLKTCYLQALFHKVDRLCHEMGCSESTLNLISGPLE